MLIVPDRSADQRGGEWARSERGLRGGARTDLPTSEAGTAFRSSPRPDEARFESHARQLCASPIPQPCVLVLPYQALPLVWVGFMCNEAISKES